MACSDINIRVAMGAVTGGTFSYVGYDANDVNGSYSDDPGLSLPQIVDNLGDDDNWVFNASANLPVGFYRFQYDTETASPPICTDSSFQTFEVVDPRCPGGDFNYITCENGEDSFFIFSQFTNNSPCGSVVLGDIENTDSPTGADGSNTTSPPFLRFNPDNNDVGDHEFVHTAADPTPTTGFTLVEGCPDCNPTATGVITVRPDIGLTNNDLFLDCAVEPCDVSMDSLINVINNETAPAAYEGHWTYISGTSPVDFYINGNLGTYTTGDELSPNGPNINVPDEIALLLDLSDAPAGDYTFEYCVFPETVPVANRAPGASSFICRNCRQATVTIERCNVSVNITSVDIECDWTIEAEHPDLGTQAMKTTFTPDDIEVVKEVTYILSDCNGVVDTVVASRTGTGTLGTSLVPATSQGILDGGFYTVIEMWSTTSGLLSIPVAPLTATLTGDGGTVASGDLIFDSSDASTYTDALVSVIMNWLGDQGYSDGVNYENVSAVTVGSYSPTNGQRVRVGTGGRHLPSNEFIGISRQNSSAFTIDRTGDGSDVVTTSNLPTISGGMDITTPTYNFTASSYDICSTITGIVDIDNNFALLPSSSSDFDEFVPQDDTPSFTNVSTSETCTTYELTANVSDCSDSISYDWSTGETTQVIVVEPSFFPYEVTVDCPDASCQATDSITVN